MDAYEATRVVFSRIQALDPDNAAKIMGLLLIQDHGNKEMIRLAFGPETLLHSVVLKARNDLGLLLPPSDPSPPPYLLSRQNSTPRLLSPSSWAPPPCFSRTNSANGNHGSGDELLNHDVRVSGGSSATTSPFYGGDLIDDHQLHDRLSFLNDPTAAAAQIGPKGGDLLYQDVPGECGSPSGNGDGVFYPYLTGWAANNHRRRSCSVADLCVGSDVAGSGWKPCVYFARGYCKNGSSCRFLHGHPDDSAVADAVVEHQCQELLLRSKSQRLSGGGAAQLMASAAALHYSLTGAALPSPSASTKCMDLLLQHQQQQNDIQRAAAATAALMMGGDEANKFMGRTRIERSDSAGMMMNPGSRQIYLTFPADSTFQEEDVSNYFSIYGPVQDVRIPYQLKRMFGFVTFVYSETVRLILAKGNPHFVCDSRVLVKPYKEKGKVPDKKQQQQGDFSPTGMDSRDPYDLQHLGARMMYSSTSSNQEMLLRRKLEQQHAIELQERRFMELQLGCLTTSTAAHINSTTAGSTPEQLSPEGNSPSTPAAASTALSFSQAADRILSSRSSHGFLHQAPVNAAAADKEESAGERSSHQDSDFHESFDHNLPDSPFASPTRASPPPTNSHRLFAATSTLDMASYNSCFFQMPRFSSGHGAVEM